VGCGTGRHAIELTKRGFKVLGIDLSEDQLAKARANASAEGVDIDFQRCDARAFDFEEGYDAAIMLCEGAFPLMETDEMNYEILKNVFKSLKPGGKFIFTTLNGLFPLYHSVKDALGERSVENSFDLMTFRDYSRYEMVDDDGNKKMLECNERYYVPSEIFWLLKSIGFRGTEIFGAKLGKFSREDKLTVDDFEMLVVTNK